MKKNNFKKLITCYCALLVVLVAQGQDKTENLVIVTLDGMRWQEVFKGIDETLATTVYIRGVLKK
jgi:hypothetical protein